jgi:hypothetical protein
MKNYVFGLIVSLAFLGFTNCGKKDSSLGEVPSRELLLKVGEEKIFILPGVEEGTGNTIKIKFISFYEGRCPRENCSLCYGGYVHCYFNIQVNNQKGDSLDLKRISCILPGDLQRDDQNMDRKVINGIEIGLSNITELDKNTQATNYSVKLNIIKL